LTEIVHIGFNVTMKLCLLLFVLLAIVAFSQGCCFTREESPAPLTGILRLHFLLTNAISIDALMNTDGWFAC